MLKVIKNIKINIEFNIVSLVNKIKYKYNGTNRQYIKIYLVMKTIKFKCLIVIIMSKCVINSKFAHVGCLCFYIIVKILIFFFMIFK